MEGLDDLLHSLKTQLSTLLEKQKEFYISAKNMPLVTITWHLRQTLTTLKNEKENEEKENDIIRLIENLFLVHNQYPHEASLMITVYNCLSIIFSSCLNQDSPLSPETKGALLDLQAECDKAFSTPLTKTTSYDSLCDLRHSAVYFGEENENYAPPSPSI